MWLEYWHMTLGLRATKSSIDIHRLSKGKMTSGEMWLEYWHMTLEPQNHQIIDIHIFSKGKLMSREM